MKILVSICMFLAMTSRLAGAQAAKTENDESRILSLENAWSQAEVVHDARALAPLLADTFAYTDDDGSFMNRDQWLAHVNRGDDHYQQLANEDQIVRVYGDAAVVTGKYREKVDRNGKSVVLHGRFTDTWIKENGTWRCVASQSTLITN
jgi:ketosteroid isomerase-like protein